MRYTIEKYPKLNKLIVVVAILAIIVNIALYASHQGLETGMEAFSEISIGPSLYYHLGQLYLYITLILFIYLIGIAIKIELLSQLMCVSSLILIVTCYMNLYSLKSVYFGSTEPFQRLLLKVLPLDWVGFALIFILSIFQIVTILHYWFFRHRK